MGTPLNLRITSTFDPSGTTQAKSAFNSLSTSIQNVNTQTTNSFDSFNRMTAALAGVKVQAPAAFNPGITAIGAFQGALLRAFTVIRQFRREAFVLTLIAAPIVIAIKRAQELDEALRPLITRLQALGQAGEFEGKRLLAFAEATQRTTGIRAKETIQALDILITKTRTAADAEAIITTAQRLHFATGAKVVDITKALADAFDGNAASLSALTGKTQQEINALLRSGDLVKELDKAFGAAAERGISSFSGRLELLPQQIKNVFGDLFKFASAPPRATFSFFDSIVQQIINPKKQVEELQKLLDGILLDKRTPNLRSFEELQISAGKAADEVKVLQSILADRNNNLTPKELADAEQILSVKQNEQKVLESLVARERELATATRERLAVATRLLDLQTSLATGEFRGAAQGQTSTQISDLKKRLNQEIELQEEAKVKLEAIEEARQIFEKRGTLTEEESADIISRAENKITTARITASNKDHEITADTISNLERLKQAQLAFTQFQEDNRRGRFEGATTDDLERADELAAKRKIEIAVLGAQRERETLISQGKFTADEEERIEKELSLNVDKIREDRARKQAERELELAKLSPEQRKASEDKEKQLLDTVEKFRTGPRKTDTQVDFEIDSTKILKQLKQTSDTLDTSSEAAGLKEKLSKLLTPDQQNVQNIVKALEDSIREKKLSLNIELLQNNAQQQELASNIGELISRAVLNSIRQKLSPQAIIQELVGGASQGGSEQ